MPTTSRLVGGLVGAAALVAALVACPAQANAAEIALSTQQVSEIQQRMSDLGIDAATQSVLISRLSEGVLPESSDPAALPVSTTEVSDEVGTMSRETFADGSRRLTVASADDAGTAIESSKSGCKSSGGWYVDCKIEISDWFSNASFVVDYQTSTSGTAKVRDVRSARCANTIGGCSVSASVKRATQSSAGPAWAELAYKADIVHIGSGVNGAFGIRVSGTSVTLYG